MKRIKLFEQFNSEPVNEGAFKEIDIIAQECENKEEFLTKVKEYLQQHAADPKVADNAEYMEELASTYFDEEGNKKEA